jgi:hypothetical protein
MVTGWCREKVAARIDLADKPAPIPAAPDSTILAPAPSLEQGAGDKTTKGEKEESEIPLQAESESSLQEERGADEKKEP